MTTDFDREVSEDDGFLFIEMFERLSQAAYKNAERKGFYDIPCDDATRIALMHSELSEALEALRTGSPDSTKIPDYSNLEEELADVIIRILDYSWHRNLDVGMAIIAKMRHNSTRPAMHGGKKF